MKRLAVKRLVGQTLDTRNRPIPSYERFEDYLRATAIAPMTSTEQQEMNISLTETSFNVIVKGSTELTTDDIVEYLGVDFRVVSVKRYTEGIGSLKVTAVTISYSGGAL